MIQSPHMVEAFGLQLGTVFQGGTMVAMMSLLAIVGRAWIVGIPERLRIANEGKVTAASELSERYKAWRIEVHGLKNDMMLLTAKQKECDQHLSDAHNINRQNQTQIHTMLFLIRLLLKELERLAPDSLIVHQAKITLEQLGHDSDTNKSSAVLAAEHTVEAAKVAVEEVKHAEEENGGDSK